MREDSIVVACDAGIPVVLAATRRAAGRLDRMAEDLLVAGAELEIISGVERTPARLAEIVDRLDRPAVIALCYCEEDLELDAVRALLADLDDSGHLRVECELGTGPAGAALQPIMTAMRKLVRRSSDTALPIVVDVVRQRGEHVSDAILVPPLLPSVIVTERPRPAWRATAKHGLVGAGACAALAMCIAVFHTTEPSAHMAALGHDDAFAEHTPRPAVVRDDDDDVPLERLQLTAPLPRVQLAAQGPAPEPTPPEPTPPAPEPTPPAPDVAPTELDAAIADRLALVDGNIVAHVVAGDRDWYGAMNTCRSRGFWGTRGWRVPTVAELHALARTRAFGDALAWSTRRGATDSETAVAMKMRSGSTTTLDKRATEPSTICVKTRG